jgi:type IV pilus assembly protein PilA
MKTKTKLSGQHGFSLVELLVVIAVIAIIAAIAIPNIANITSQARVAKDQRNAQNVASVAAAAKAAGAQGDLSGTNVVSTLQTPVTVTNGANVMSFSVSTMSAAEQAGAATYLSANSDTNGGVLYNPGTN